VETRSHGSYYTG